ncbi:MAG: hypothetical protein HQL39_16345 [Alphaproteobacteria bacterium]|nr:hypothetical protein [Alphaproteobacteria bacterium]
MRNSASVVIQGDKLQPELAAALDGGEAEAVYAVHIKKLTVEEAAEFLEMRAKIQEGIADIEAGNILDEDEAFALLEAKYGKI